MPGPKTSLGCKPLDHAAGLSAACGVIARLEKSFRKTQSGRNRWMEKAVPDQIGQIGEKS